MDTRRNGSGEFAHMSARRLVLAGALWILTLILIGCIGWGDMFAPHRKIAGDYFLQKFEDGNLFLMVDGESGSIAGPISEVGWTRDVIIVNSPEDNHRWMVIDLRGRKVFRGNKGDEVAGRLGSSVHLMSPAEAWKRAGESR